MKVKIKVKEVVKDVFLITTKSAYDIAMMFIRYQEFYESPKFRNKLFKLTEYMEWYAKNIGNNSFSYPADYVGFNVPGRLVLDVLIRTMNKDYSDLTVHDWAMCKIIKKIWRKSVHPYVIGVSKENGGKSTIRHEIAHGLYYTNSSYRTEVLALFKTVPAKLKRSLFKALRKRQYHRSVFIDEINAFLSTGLHGSWDNKLPGAKPYQRRFQRLFKKYYPH